LKKGRFNNMVQWFKSTLAILLTVLIFLGCGTTTSRDTGPRGQILVWHGWSGPEAEILDQLLDQFMVIYPEVTIIQESKPLAEIGDVFLDQAKLGMGPDILIAPARWEPGLAEAGVIQKLDEQEIDTSAYLPALVQQLRTSTGLYALPLSAHTYALYYNKTKVDEPPATLAELLDRAAQGQLVALETSFYGAVWGVQAFGGQLFDQQGRVVPDQEGFGDWLVWLKKAQSEPNVIMSADEGQLFDLFRDNRVAYYVGGSNRLVELQQVLGSEVVGAAPLPAGPRQPAAPFLQAEALMFNAASTPGQTILAILLARFLTNEAQQTRLARQAGRVPANARVRIDARVAPAIAGFIAQSKTAVPLPVSTLGLQTMLAGDQIYVQTLEGVLEPAEATRELTRRLTSPSSDAPSGGEGDAP
jgi:maltose-binding protein MalE